MSKTLAEILGWEEGATYKVGELYYSVVGVNLYYFKDFDSPHIKTNQDIIIDLLELVNEAEKVEPKKYYLKHKYLGAERFAYLNYSHEFKDFELETKSFEDNYQTKFTEEEIKEIEEKGFDLTNFERVEVEDE